MNLIVCLILFSAGVVKGVVGFGVPTISLALLLSLGIQVTAVSGRFLLPTVPFMQLSVEEREKYIQALGVVFCNLAIALSCSLAIKNDFTQSVSALSIAGSIAALCGMHFGKIYRQKMSKVLSEKAVLITMLVVGVVLIARYFGDAAITHASAAAV